jgi:hypothetical protein
MTLTLEFPPPVGRSPPELKSPPPKPPPPKGPEAPVLFFQDQQ